MGGRVPYRPPGGGYPGGPPGYPGLPPGYPPPPSGGYPQYGYQPYGYQAPQTPAWQPPDHRVNPVTYIGAVACIVAVLVGLGAAYQHGTALANGAVARSRVVLPQVAASELALADSYNQAGSVFNREIGQSDEQQVKQALTDAETALTTVETRARADRDRLTTLDTSLADAETWLGPMQPTSLVAQKAKADAGIDAMADTVSLSDIQLQQVKALDLLFQMVETVNSIDWNSPDFRQGNFSDLNAKIDASLSEMEQAMDQAKDIHFSDEAIAVYQDTQKVLTDIRDIVSAGEAGSLDGFNMARATGNIDLDSLNKAEDAVKAGSIEDTYAQALPKQIDQEYSAAFGGTTSHPTPVV